jgi:GNAT superfamily N-acetyltransferase
LHSQADDDPDSVGPEVPAEPVGRESLRTADFFRPERFLAALRDTGYWVGGEAPADASSPDRTLPSSEARKPLLVEYAVFWKERLLPWVSHAAADVVVMLAASGEQEKAVRAAVEGLDGAARPSLVSARNGQELARVLPTRAHLPLDAELAVRVIRDLARAPYYAPGPVCSFEAFSSDSRLEEMIAGITAGAPPAGYLFGESVVGPDPETWLRQGPLTAVGGTPVSVALPVGTLLPRDTLELAYQSGLRVIRWQWRENVPEEFLRCLMDASSAGVWNHLSVPEGHWGQRLAGFAAKNPNIVHSATSTPDHPMLFAGPLSTPPAGASGYGKLQPLAGQPFWTLLSDPSHLLLYVAELGAGELSRLRVAYPAPKVRSLGREINYRFLRPSALSEGQLDEICSMILSGGAVGGHWVQHNLKRAFLIALAEEHGMIAGISSLKHPREEYVARVRDKCGLDIRGYLERGYTSVRPEYRGQGLGTRLLEGLTARAEGRPIFSIIRETDVASQKMAARNGTRRVVIFHSERMDAEVGIWMPEGQLPQGLADPAEDEAAGP